MRCGESDGLVSSSVHEKVAQLAGELLQLQCVAGTQLRVLFDELEVADVARGVGDYLGAEGEDDRAELFDGLGDAPDRSEVVFSSGCGDRLEQLWLSAESDLLLVAEVAEERGAANFGALSDVADRDLIKAAREEELLSGLNDALSRLALLALDERNGRSHGRSIHDCRPQSQAVRHTQRDKVLF